jgi:hypothetical protein
MGWMHCSVEWDCVRLAGGCDIACGQSWLVHSRCLDLVTGSSSRDEGQLQGVLSEVCSHSRTKRASERLAVEVESSLEGPAAAEDRAACASRGRTAAAMLLTACIARVAE